MIRISILVKTIFLAFAVSFTCSYAEEKFTQSMKDDFKKIRTAADKLGDFSDTADLFPDAEKNMKESDSDFSYFKEEGLFIPENLIHCNRSDYGLRLISPFVAKATLLCTKTNFEILTQSFLDEHSKLGWSVYKKEIEHLKYAKKFSIIVQKNGKEFMLTVTGTDGYLGKEKIKYSKIKFEQHKKRSIGLVDFYNLDSEIYKKIVD